MATETSDIVVVLEPTRSVPVPEGVHLSVSNKASEEGAFRIQLGDLVTTERIQPGATLRFNTVVGGDEVENVGRVPLQLQW